MCKSHEALQLDIKYMKKEFEWQKKVYENFRKDNFNEHWKLFTAVSEIKDILVEMNLEVKTKYITREEAKEKFALKQVQNIVYGMVWIILTAILWAILVNVVW